MQKENKLSCSYQTKEKLAKSLKDTMKKTPFEKISVLNITNNCSVHRQTFYYHFDDKYELLEWIIYDELIEPLIDGFTLDTMYDRFKAMFTTMKNDESFYKSAFKIDFDEIAIYLNNTITAEFSSIVRKIEDENNAPLESTVDELLLSQFISYGIIGVVSNWAQHGMKESPEYLTESIKHVINGLKKLMSNSQ